MKFRPCIDIHNGQVKQIVGGSLKDLKDQAKENFVSEYDAAFYANLYKENDLKGGHVILLNASDSPYYEETKRQALLALNTYPQGLMVGGGIRPDNAEEFLKAGASHVIVTSYVFHDGRIDMDRLNQLVSAVGKEHLVLDLSAKKVDGEYHIMTERWQNASKEILNIEMLDELKEYSSEYLIHAVDVEGKAGGIEKELTKMLGQWGKIPMTYAGGVHNFEDLQLLKELGNDYLDVTIGSALDLFGGTMQWEKVLDFMK